MVQRFFLFLTSSILVSSAWAAVPPTDLEQYMLELTNRARANPTAEAALFGIALNEGLAAGTISSAPKEPLAMDEYLTDAARSYAGVLLADDEFSHTYAGTPPSRCSAVGYPGSSIAENLAVRTTSSSPSMSELISQTASLHEQLFVDAGIAGRGHRINILNENNNNLGIGIDTDPAYHPSAFPMPFPSILACQNFGTRSGNFLTGVVYEDLDMDAFYTPGEGWGGVQIEATRQSDMMVFTTTTWSTGGYTLELPPGTYTVVASGGGMAGTITRLGVTIGSDNVKQDFDPSTAIIPCASMTCADCNGDGSRNIVDALLAAQHAATILTITGPNFVNCNVQGPPGAGGSVDILDALSIAQFVAGLPVMLSCC